ncbi:MAG: hypothetical protein ABJN95_07455 [Maribacter sp.]|uniref:hypothetical protein n=1 Tax=Maribacter sp. TaxID=1897614 RepID=UPI0032977CBA
MNLETLRLLFDFGLLVLIWLVQLVIYPSFRFYQQDNLVKWHRKYTVGIALVVIPLMFVQLTTAILQLLEFQNTLTIGSLVLIALVWAITFLQFVPMHRKISDEKADKILLTRLVKRNWWRTLLWSVIFILTLLSSL